MFVHPNTLHVRCTIFYPCFLLSNGNMLRRWFPHKCLSIEFKRFICWIQSWKQNKQPTLFVRNWEIVCVDQTKKWFCETNEPWIYCCIKRILQIFSFTSNAFRFGEIELNVAAQQLAGIINALRTIIKYYFTLDRHFVWKFAQNEKSQFTRKYRFIKCRFFIQWNHNEFFERNFLFLFIFFCPKCHLEWACINEFRVSVRLSLYKPFNKIKF